MAYEVFRHPDVKPVVESMTKKEEQDYDAAVAGLKGQGCVQGGKRLMATGGGDYYLCQRSLYGDWRMTLAFHSDGRIFIVQVARHTDSHNPNQIISEVFEGLSATGRKRSQQPPCCEDPALPPVSPETDAILNDLFLV